MFWWCALYQVKSLIPVDNAQLCARNWAQKAWKLLSSHKSQNSFPIMPCCLNIWPFHLQYVHPLFFFLSHKSASLRSVRSLGIVLKPLYGQKILPVHLQISLQPALSNGLLPYSIWPGHTARLHCWWWTVRMWVLKRYRTEDNISSLNNTKQFSQSDGTAAVSFVGPASWLTPALSSLIFLFQTLCYNQSMGLYIYFGCTVQCGSKLCKIHFQICTIFK